MSISKSNEPIAHTVAKLVEESGMKKGVVAKRAGFSLQAFSDMLNGRRLIKVSEVPGIAKALGVTPNELYCNNPTDQQTA